MLVKDLTGNEQEFFKKKYADGYGIHHPEGHIIRIYHQILKYEFGLTSGKVFDFGMGTGVHLSWLVSQGDWEPYGCDISAEGVQQTQLLMPQYKDHFIQTSPNPELGSLFDVQFDFILTNQVLYYMEDEVIENVVEQLHKMLKPGGLFLASMMTTKNWYYSLSEEIEGSTLRRVDIPGRLNEETFINFRTQEELSDTFKLFERLHIGYYDSAIREDEGPGHHGFFLGRKSNTSD